MQDGAGSAIDEALNTIAAAAAAGATRSTADTQDLEGSVLSEGSNLAEAEIEAENDSPDLALGAECSVDAGACCMRTSLVRVRHPNPISLTPTPTLTLTRCALDADLAFGLLVRSRASQSVSQSVSQSTRRA